MYGRALGPSGDVRDERTTVNARFSRNRRVRSWYLATSLTLVILYPVLPGTGRNAVFLLASLGAVPAVLVGLRRISPGKRRPWMLLLAAVVAINVANLVGLIPGHLAFWASNLLDAAGAVLVLAATMALVARQGRDNLGSIIDTTIAALALGGVLWDVVLAPNLVSDYQAGPARLAICVVVFALSGVVGALAQMVIMRPVAALWPIIAASGLALVANMVVAVTTDPQLNTAAALMFIGAYTGVGLFGLDTTAFRLVTAFPVRPDALSFGRLVFLGLAVAIVPVVVGTRELLGGDRDGLVLVLSSATIATLVMVRIGQLTGQRDKAEQALRHEATHDSLTGLLNRKEFVTRVGGVLASGQDCAILFCDLDRFKAVNDRFGHARGDQILIEVAHRLRDCLRAGDLVSRFGGDEFVMFFRGATAHEVHAIDQRVIQALARPFEVSDELVTIGVSTGTAHANGEVDPEELIVRADRAMYAAKSSDV
jgi:diguanylate cyclase